MKLLRAILVSSPLLGIGVLILSWDLSFVPPFQGVDGSWEAAIQLAAHDGLQWGPEVVYTYGPLGFLNIPVLYFQDQAVLALFYGAALHLALCIMLVWSLRRILPLILAVAAAFLLALIPSIDIAAVLVACGSLFVLDARSRRATSPYAVVGGAIAAFELLFKLNIGIEILAMVIVCLAASDDRRRNLPLLGASLSVSFLGLWLIAGQDLANLTTYFARSLDVVSGYSQGQQVAPPGGTNKLAAGVLTGLILLGIAWLGTRSRTRRLQVGVLAVTGVFWFALFKEGFVRQDPAHTSVFFGTALVAAAILASRLKRAGAVSWGNNLVPGALAALPAVGLIAIFTVQSWPAESRPELSPVTHLRTFVATARDLFGPSRREALLASSRLATLTSSQLDPVTLRLLGSHTVQFDPWEVQIAWAFYLSWKPLPVFQNDVNYTSGLDEINADALASSTGPQRILRLHPAQFQPGAFPSGALDNRYPGQDSPATRISQLCHYVDIRTTDLFQVLARVQNRCGKPRLIGSVEARYGTPVKVPVPRRRHLVVFARIYGAGPNVLGRIRQFMLRASYQEITLDGSGGVRFRFIPATATDGLLMWTPKWVDYRPPFALGPMAHQFTLSGGNSALRVDFYAIRVHRSGHLAADRQ